MSEELLPCPFCGGSPRRVDIPEGDNQGGSCIECATCGACSPVHFDRKENLEHSWNRRTDAALRSTAELTQELANLRVEYCLALGREEVAHDKRLAELRGALEVFGAVADAYARAHEQHVDEGLTGAPALSDGHRVSVALGDCRIARTALASSSTKET